MSKLQDAFFITVIVLMVIGTAVINHAQAATPKSHAATSRSYKVKGVRYHPLKSAVNFSQTGKASWYGPGFHGKKTSNGERYNMHALTAAHKTLPLGTMVRVSNLGNGKSVVVRINDRGPFHGNRIIDLSKAAAGRLGFISNGMARVKVESLNKTLHADAADSETVSEAVQTAAAPVADTAIQTAAAEKPAAPAANYLTLAKPVAEIFAKAVSVQPTLYLDSQKFADIGDANLFLKQVAQAAGSAYPVSLHKDGDGSHIVRIGPVQKHEQLEELKKHLAQKRPI